MQPTDLLTLGLIAVMVFMMFRSSRKRKKQAADLQAQLVAGSKVMLHSGIIGRVVSVTDDHVIVNTAGSNIEVVKGAVRTVSVWEAAEEAKPEVATAAAKPAATKTATAKPAAAKPAAAKPAAPKAPAAKKTTTAKPAAKKPAAKTEN